LDDERHQHVQSDDGRNKDEPSDWFSAVERAHEHIRPALANRRYVSVTDIIYDMRERRDAQLLGNLLRGIAESKGEYVDESSIRGDSIGEKPDWQILLEFAWNEEEPKWDPASGDDSPLEIVIRKRREAREQERRAETEGQRNEGNS
jgi:hypothetical protein